MRILVTGGAGFIGSHVVEYFQRDAEVRVLDDMSSGSRHNLDHVRCEFKSGSILDRERVREAMQGVDYVFHLAAMVSVPESVLKPLECVQTNTVGTLLVLEEAARAGVKKLVFSSSAAIYGNNPAVPKIETMAAEPESPYASTKLDGEFYCRLFEQETSLSTVCLRYFNVFGPRQNPRSQYAAAVPIFIDRALRHEPLTIYGDGGQTRDFIHVRDVAAANAHFALNTKATGVFNLASGQAGTINELAKEIISITGSQSKIIHAPGRLGDVRHSCADINKARSVGFKTTTLFAEGLPDTIRWYSEEIALP